jgi:hypothetical protein
MCAAVERYDRPTQAAPSAAQRRSPEVQACRVNFTADMSSTAASTGTGTSSEMASTSKPPELAPLTTTRESQMFLTRDARREADPVGSSDKSRLAVSS